MKPVIQEEQTGCGIACVATLTGSNYRQTRETANAMGICASDPALWSDTGFIRRLLGKFGIETSDTEIPFESWSALPDTALLSIKHYRENNRDFWHWVVFHRHNGQARVLDSASHLTSNSRTDFANMQPEWYIRVDRPDPPRAVTGPWPALARNFQTTAAFEAMSVTP